jgi:7,8-dihydroneopterin aldolase/epimerase/oxygenase
MSDPVPHSLSDSGVIYIRGVEFEANHGYTAAERKATRRFRLNLEIHTTLSRAALSDRLSDTIDYRKVCEVATQIGTQRTFKLLEALAGHIGHAIRELCPRANAVFVELEKLAPPCPGVPQACGVRLRID